MVTVELEIFAKFKFTILTILFEPLELTSCVALLVVSNFASVFAKIDVAAMRFGFAIYLS